MRLLISLIKIGTSINRKTIINEIINNSTSIIDNNRGTFFFWSHSTAGCIIYAKINARINGVKITFNFKNPHINIIIIDKKKKGFTHEDFLSGIKIIKERNAIIGGERTFLTENNRKANIHKISILINQLSLIISPFLNQFL